MKALGPARGGRRILAVAACLAIFGCGETWEADTYPASGRISINGKPPAGALVQLFPTGARKTDDRDSRPWGLVKDDGTYVLATYNAEPGAPAGDYMLTLTWPPDASRPSMVDKLRRQYATPEKSRWKVTVAKGDNVLPLVELNDVKIDDKAGSVASKPVDGLSPPLETTKTRRGRGRR